MAVIVKLNLLEMMQSCRILSFSTAIRHQLSRVTGGTQQFMYFHSNKSERLRIILIEASCSILLKLLG
jgi:hypothetical protein